MNLAYPLKKIHRLLAKIAILIFVLPALVVAGRILKTGLFSRGSVKKTLKNHARIVEIIQPTNLFVRICVESTLGLAITLSRTWSFTETIRQMFRTLGGVPTFSSKTMQFMDFLPNSETRSPLRDHYVSFLTTRAAQEKSPDFVALQENQSSIPPKSDVRAIAFYLPQFHSFPLNDEWYGKGFTEWNNVTRTIPQYTNHNQPQLPIDIGYYSLENTAVMYRQIELAKMYNIYGFCFHYYWFSGTRLMEKPIFNWLKESHLNFPFCLNWANENWSKLWDGGDREIKYKQTLLPEDDEKFFNDIVPFFQDPRYMTVCGKPLFLIYRPNLFPQRRCHQFTDYLRKKSLEYGFPGLYIVSVNSHGFQENPSDWGCDAMVEFPPHCMQNQGLIPKTMDCFINPFFDGQIWDGEEFVRHKKYLYETNYKLFKGVFPSWDNTPRKAYSNGSVIEGVTPAVYKEWLSGCVAYTRQHHTADERLIFINAWNEWAEGAHLEPDSRYGYAYLQATRDALTGTP